MKKKDTVEIPLLALRGLIIFPSMVTHLDVGRDKSVKALEEAMVKNEQILLVSQKEDGVDEPTPEDIYSVGTVVNVKQMIKLPNGTFRVLVEGLYRTEIIEYIQEEPYYIVTSKEIIEESGDEQEEEAYIRTILDQFKQYVKLSKKVSKDTLSSVSDIADASRVTDLITSHLTLKLKDKQQLLEISHVIERMKKLIEFLADEKKILNLEKSISQHVKESMEKTQKEYYLREQLKAIQKELGDADGKTGEIAELTEKINTSDMPTRVKEVAEKELKRYERVPQSSGESSVIRNYLEWLLDLPWTNKTEDMIDVTHAEKVLDKAHYGLDKVKERILEYLAVQKLTNSIKGPILCLVGPPGVGKTSLVKSIAEAINRKYVRISLGGVRDEAEIRGHRRTYIGAMPGRIIQGMKRAETVNPVFLLDEIDKMSNDFRGDPSSAMLEVLDPEQNHNFSDHFIEETYDLSNVLFVATANYVNNIPGPLLDRMELISLAG